MEHKQASRGKYQLQLPYTYMTNMYFCVFDIVFTLNFVPLQHVVHKVQNSQLTATITHC